MACFPRLRGVFPRQKSSYNPAQDENTDTMLNIRDSPVQIGRYIHREETPLFTPKTSESTKQLRKVQQLQQQETHQQHDVQQPSNETTNHTNNTNNKHLNNIIATNTGTSGNHINTTTNSGSTSNYNSTNNNNSNNNNNNNALHKKFISHLNRSNSTKANNILKLNVGSNNNGSSSHNSSFNNGSNKLKPCKGRRPTALPNEIPHFAAQSGDNDTANGNANSSDDADDSAQAAPLTPGSMQNVRFFIGTSHRNSNDNDSNDGDTMSLAELLLGSGSGTTSRQNSAAMSRCWSHASGSANSSRNPSISSAFRPHFKSTAAAGKTKLSRKTRAAGTPTEELQIPAPPPLPPQLLTTASSTASLISLRKSMRTAAAAAAAAAEKADGNKMADGENGATNKNNGGQLSNDAGATTTAANDGKCSFDRQMCTIAEVLNFSNASATSGNSVNGRDSGVQVEDSTPSPKDSENSDSSTKTHRVEGGLIFTRPNLPAKNDVHIEFVEKDEATRNLIRKAIEKNDFLNNYMDKERKEMVIDAMAPAAYQRNSFIIHENDEGSEIYVSEEGSFEVLKADRVVGNFGPATVFGELAILYNANRLASVRATTNARVWRISRGTFRQIMLLSESKEREENLQFLRSVPLLHDLSEEVLNKVVDLLQRKFYETNACIVREGEVGNEFFIIRGGTVTIKKINGQAVERVVDRRKRGEYFGEQALLNADRRQASVYADAPGTEVLKLDRESFISYLGTIPQLHERPIERKDTMTSLSSRKAEFDNEYAHIQLADLKKIETLGAGAFGRVDLVAHNNKTFALKIIKKIDVVKQDQVEHVYSEKHVMMKCRSSPFIIELYKTFRNEKFIYFLMEACMGGDVWTVMSQRRFFDEKTARFIAGCVVEAFDFLHSHNIIYRDLKPENLMLTTDGYCKLVDFGFAKHIPPNQKTNTFAGTPEYVAPEIILDRGHDRSVDYWALGILIFELLVGKTPFRGQNQIKIYQQILGGIDVIQMPSKIPKAAQGLIKHLCKQLPAERLGYQRKGIWDIKRHSWFDHLDWNKLKYKQLTSPIKRPINSNTDLQYFGPPDVDHEYDPPDETSGWDKDF